MNDAMTITSPEDVGLCSQRLARIDAWRDKLVEDGKFAGVSTLVARRGQVAHWGMSGLADRERGVRMAPDTVFRIYSMSKPITSAAIMMLYKRRAASSSTTRSAASCPASRAAGWRSAAAAAR